MQRLTGFPFLEGKPKGMVVIPVAGAVDGKLGIKVKGEAKLFFKKKDGSEFKENITIKVKYFSEGMVFIDFSSGEYAISKILIKYENSKFFDTEVKFPRSNFVIQNKIATVTPYCLVIVKEKKQYQFKVLNTSNMQKKFFANYFRDLKFEELDKSWEILMQK